MSVAFAFVSDPLRAARVDGAFVGTADALTAAGLRVWTYDAERRRIVSRGETVDGATVVYRGWMMNAEEYAAFAACVVAAGAHLLHDVDAYLATHHSPRWVPVLGLLTPETAFFAEGVDVAAELVRLGWEGFVLKDWVKSLKTTRGSIIRDPADAPEIVAEMRKYRGTIEGGLVVRRFEPLRPETEIRYFVLGGRAWAPTPDAAVPDVVLEVLRRVSGSRFFSVDVAEREDRALRVVEIGDGQVSDLVGAWTAARFAEMWSSPAGASDSAL